MIITAQRKARALSQALLNPTTFPNGSAIPYDFDEKVRSGQITNAQAMLDTSMMYTVNSNLTVRRIKFIEEPRLLDLEFILYSEY